MKTVVSGVLLGASFFVACGSSDVSSFGSGNGGAGDGGAAGDPRTGGFADDGTDAGPSSDVTPASACVTSSAAGTNAPAYLVFMFDRSNSMASDSKWTSCASGLKTFFADPSTTGIAASLHFFPQYAGADLVCDASGYATPAVAMRALPDAQTFSTAIDATTLVYNTPTLPALQGALDYAAKVKAAHAGAKVAVVLVTDGLPNHCGSTVDSAANAAGSAAGATPTYVIGVGNETSNLDAIALAGGTSKAVIVDTSTPAQIVTDFEKALGQVKTDAASCQYSIPAPPAGQTLDVNRVNVSLTTGGHQSTLTYDASCASGSGWHYDNAAAPTTIEICPASCDSIKSDPAAKIDILFGCAVQGTVK